MLVDYNLIKNAEICFRIEPKEAIVFFARKKLKLHHGSQLIIKVISVYLISLHPINSPPHIRLTQKPVCLACFFSRNSIFLSQQFSLNSVFQPVSAKILPVERGRVPLGSNLFSAAQVCRGLLGQLEKVLYDG